METFKVGDIVHLKSGGPDMTITEYPVNLGGMPGHTITYDDRAKCTWFDKNGDVHNETFNLAILELD